jgi:hypothetical protein
MRYVTSYQLRWIPAFAGMTDVGRNDRREREW